MFQYFKYSNELSKFVLIFCLSLQLMCWLSEDSVEICERIIQNKLHVDMLGYLNWNALSANSLNDPKSKVKRSFVHSSVTILYNVVRIKPEFCELFRSCQAVESLDKFFDVTSYPVTFLIFSISFLQATFAILQT